MFLCDAGKPKAWVQGKGTKARKPIKGGRHVENFKGEGGIVLWEKSSLSTLAKIFLANDAVWALHQSLSALKVWLCPNVSVEIVPA